MSEAKTRKVHAPEFKAKLSQMVLFTLVMVIALVVFRNSSLMSPNWTYPYFSGAQHLDSSFKRKCSLDGYRHFRTLSTPEMFAYDFSKEGDQGLIDCAYNDFGYLGVVIAAKTVLPFLSYIRATVVLQSAIHIVITLIIASFFKRFLFRSLFVLAYGANPIIIHFVTLAFYYFWQVLASFLFLLLLGNNSRSRSFSLLMYPLLFLSFLVRSSVLPLIAFVAMFAIGKAQPEARPFHVTMGLLLAAAIGVTLVIGDKEQQKQPWHTMYIGLGAYENSYMKGLADENGFLFYKEQKNVEIDTSLGTGNFYDAGLRRDYYETVKKRYLDILKTDYYRVFRNAILNTVQSFSVGYLIDYPRLRLASILAGIAVLGAFLYTRQYMLILALLASSIGFVLYYPPIPAYMFGSYLLLVYGGIKALESKYARSDVLAKYDQLPRGRSGARGATDQGT